jgi:hypothetical protein
VVGDIGQVPRDVAAHGVGLTAPDAMVIAEAAVLEQDGTDAAAQVLHDEFAEKLSAGVSPGVALQAAALAIRVTNGELSAEVARQTLTEGVEKEVAERIDGSWHSMEFTMMFAIALLENEPFEEVVRQQRKLDDLVRRRELPSDAKFRPRRAFHKPNDQVLMTVGAHTELRDNPSHQGLREMTVQFTRPGWAAAVLCRIWQHYHADHDLLLEWMCEPEMSQAHFENCVWALSTLVSQVPAHDRMGELQRLVDDGSVSTWFLVAATLFRLKNTQAFTDLVDRTVRRWAAEKPYRRRCAAIVFYGHLYERSDQHELLDRIAEIAKDARPWVSIAVVGTVVGLLRKPERLDKLLPIVVDWSAERGSRGKLDGRRATALNIGMYVLGLHSDARDADLDHDLADLVLRFPLECRCLLRRIMESPKHSDGALERMQDLALWYPLRDVDERAGPALDELVVLVHLLAPDLRWWSRRRVMTQLQHRHPGSRRLIRTVFRTAGKVERSAGVTPAD